MRVLNFSYAAMKDRDVFQEYVRQAAALMHEEGVDVIVRGKYSVTKRGEQKTPHIAAVFRFRDMEAANDFYASDRYMKLVPLRDRACDMTIHFYDE